jgi:hypothetical protein
MKTLLKIKHDGVSGWDLLVTYDGEAVGVIIAGEPVLDSNKKGRIIIENDAYYWSDDE